MKRIFALDYGRGTMAGFYTDFGAKVISPRPIMDKDGEPSGFALMQDGSYRLGKQLYTMGAKDYRNATAMHINPTFQIIGKLEKFSDGNCGLSASFGNIAA